MLTKLEMLSQLLYASVERPSHRVNLGASASGHTKHAENTYEVLQAVCTALWVTSSVHSNQGHLLVGSADAHVSAPGSALLLSQLSAQTEPTAAADADLPCAPP